MALKSAVMWTVRYYEDEVNGQPALRRFMCNRMREL